MASLLGFLIVLSALTATGFSLSCIYCKDINGAECTGSTETCSAGSACASTLTKVNQGAFQNVTFERGCSPIDQCNMYRSMTVQGTNVKILTLCLNRDNCVSEMPSFPANNTELNGVTCKTCTSTTSDYCYTEDTLQCYGGETKCFHMSTYLSGSSYSSSTLRGCATPNICDLFSYQQQTYGGLTTIIKTYCSNGSIGLRSTFYFPAVITLFLIKLLF